MKKNEAYRVNKIFRVKNNRDNSLQDLQQIKSIYLNQKIVSKEIVNKLPPKRQYFSVLGTKTPKQYKNQKNKYIVSTTLRNTNSVLQPMKDFNKIPKQDILTKNFSVINQESLRIKDCQSICQKVNQSINKNVKKVAHLSYLQYEKLIQSNKLKPTYFEDLGKKNDEKYQVTGQQYKNTRDLLQTSNTQFRPVKLNRSNKHAKTQVSQKKTDTSVKTIISCAVGALSTYQIKQKLQQRWQEEQKAKRMKNNNYIFSEQSEGSEADKRQYTQTTFQEVSLFGKNHKKHKKLQALNQRTKVDWHKITNQNYKQILKKILQVKSNSLMEPEFSEGHQYQIHEQVMGTVRDVYKPKRFVMKHKLQWRV